MGHPTGGLLSVYSHYNRMKWCCLATNTETKATESQNVVMPNVKLTTL